MTSDTLAPSTLRRPGAGDVATIAAWHPLPPQDVAGWWGEPDVQPWVLPEADGSLVAYGELWVDVEEDEVELARLIVAPPLRGRGLGRRLVQLLTARAASCGLATTMLRVVPDNAVAIGCYLSCGFERLGPEESAEWNVGQRREWLWMRLAAADRGDALA